MGRLKAEVSSVLHVEFPVADTEATLQLRCWLGILRKVFFIHFSYEESHLQGKPNEGTDHSNVYTVYNDGKLVLCVFDKVSCSLRAEMPEKLHKKTIKKNNYCHHFLLRYLAIAVWLMTGRVRLLGTKHKMMQLYREYPCFEHHLPQSD